MNNNQTKNAALHHSLKLLQSQIESLESEVFAAAENFPAPSIPEPDANEDPQRIQENTRIAVTLRHAHLALSAVEAILVTLSDELSCCISETHKAD